MYLLPKLARIAGRSFGGVLEQTFTVVGIVIVVIINELRSYLRFVIVVSKQDFKFEQNPFMDSGDIGRAHQLSMCMNAHTKCHPHGFGEWPWPWPFMLIPNIQVNILVHIKASSFVLDRSSYITTTATHQAINHSKTRWTIHVMCDV